MSIPAIMEVWQHAHNFSDTGHHHDALRMFFTVQSNITAELSSSAAMDAIVTKLLRQVEVEVKAYKEVFEGNYFVALGVTNKATGSDVKKAYRKLALKHHPDKAGAGGGCGGANDLFPMIQNAYEVLSDKEARGKYRVTVSLETCLRKVRNAGKQNAGKQGGSENERPAGNAGNARNAAPPKYKSRSTSSSNTAGANNDDDDHQYYKKYQQQQQDMKDAADEKRRSASEAHQKERFERRQEQDKERKRNQGSDSQNSKPAYEKPKYHENPEDYYYQHQKKWEQRRQEEENTAWKRRMEEIRTKKAQDGAKYEKERKEEKQKRDAARKKRDEEYQEQVKEREKKEAMKKIVKIADLRAMKPKEIKERLVALGHDVKGLIEKEDYVKKYCTVTGQKYGQPPPPSSSEARPEKEDARTDDGNWGVFEDRVRSMSVKELRIFVTGRKGDLRGCVEKDEIVDKALELYVAPPKREGMGRTAFGRGGGGEEEVEEEEVEEVKVRMSRTMFGRGASKPVTPVVNTDRMREYERKMGKGNGGTGQEGDEEEEEQEEGVTLESVVKAYRRRMDGEGSPIKSPTKLTFEEEVNVAKEEEREEKEEEEEKEKEVVAPPRTPSPPSMSKEEVQSMYDNMYNFDQNGGEEEGGEEKAGGETAAENAEQSSPLADTRWQQTDRGKAFLVNGFKWGAEEAVLQEEGEGEEESDEEGVEWAPEEFSMPMPNPSMMHSVNLTAAEAAFISRQQAPLTTAEAEFMERERSRREAARAEEREVEQGGGEESSDGEEIVDKHFDFSKTLPNWKDMEEIKFWLHGDFDDGFDEEEESESEEEEGGEEEGKQGEPVNMYWGNGQA